MAPTQPHCGDRVPRGVDLSNSRHDGRRAPILQGDYPAERGRGVSHLWGLDSADPPDLATAQQRVADGWAFFGGYIGGQAERVWSRADFAVLAQAGLRIVAWWVGPLSGDPGYDQGVADGNACLEALQSCGLSGWVWDDAESGIVRRNWSAGFVAALHAGQCQVGLYGSTASIKGMGDLYDSWYLAGYPQPMESLQTWDNRIIDWDHWQVSDGSGYDYNVAVDTAPFATYNP